MDSPFHPQAKRFGISDQSKGSDGGQQQHTADTQKHGRSLGVGNPDDDFCIAGRDHQRKRQRQHAKAGEQTGDVFGPFSRGVILGEEGKAVQHEPANQQEIAGQRYQLHCCLGHHAVGRSS